MVNIKRCTKITKSKKDSIRYSNRNDNWIFLIYILIINITLSNTNRFKTNKVLKYLITTITTDMCFK